MSPSDPELMDRICRHDSEAFDLLADRYRESLLHHLLGIVRTEHAAEDLRQEVLLRIWTRAHQWDGSGSVRGWMFRIGTNLALNYLRAQRRRRELPLELPADAFAEDDALPIPAWMIDATASRPDRQFEQVDEAARIRRLIDTLPEEKRDIVLLVHDADLELREVAERLDIPEGTVKSRLFHARKRLAQQWFAENEGE